jgi:acyl CoA:acetate/3-ketoacid CoA transferase alpha subunit
MILNFVRNSSKKLKYITKVLQIRNLSSLETQNSNKYAEKAIRQIPSGSKILIGGYLDHQVPTSLLKILGNSKNGQFTVFTNASIALNQQFLDLVKCNGKIKQIVTSSEFNKPCEEKYNIETCLLNHKDYSNQTNRGEYAIVNIKYEDNMGRVFVEREVSNLFNEEFSKIAKTYTVAQIDQSSFQIDSKGFKEIDALFVNYKFFELKNSQSNRLEQESFIDPERIIKRVLLELHNNQNIYISQSIFNQFDKFYMPKHLNLNVINKKIKKLWPSLNSDWLNYVNRLDVCVLKADRFNYDGLVEFDLNDLENCLEYEICNYLKGHRCKLISIMDEDNSKIESSKRLAQINKMPDLIISKRGVFRYNHSMNVLDSLEKYHPNINSENYSNLLNCFNVNENGKIMKQECF